MRRIEGVEKRLYLLVYPCFEESCRVPMKIGPEHWWLLRLKSLTLWSQCFGVEDEPGIGDFWQVAFLTGRLPIHFLILSCRAVSRDPATQSLKEQSGPVLGR